MAFFPAARMKKRRGMLHGKPKFTFFPLIFIKLPLLDKNKS